MKVLHVIPSLGPFRGGPSFALRTMTRGLARAGVEVHVATTNDNGPERLQVPLAQPVVEDGVTTFYFPAQTQELYTVSVPLSRWLRAHVRDYDLVHIHSLFSYSSNVAGFHARRAKVPYIVRTLGHLNRWGMTKRRRQLKELSLRLLENRLLRGAVCLHFASQQEQQEAAQGGIRLPCFVSPLGVDQAALEKEVDCEPLLARYPALRDRFVILYLSRLHPIKGLDLLLPAFALLHKRHPHVVLLLAGDGDEEFVKQLRAQVEELNLQDAVVQTGFVGGDDKLRAFHVADVFVLPSYSENFANAPVEAMTMGVPVVLSDQVGVAATISEANAGLVVPCTVEALYDALERLTSDSALRRTLSLAGRQLVEEKFSVTATTRALTEQYRAVLNLHSV